jgi:hypothetical protein
MVWFSDHLCIGTTWHQNQILSTVWEQSRLHESKIHNYSLDIHIKISSFEEDKNKIYTSLPDTNKWAPKYRAPLKGNLNPADQTRISHPVSDSSSVILHKCVIITMNWETIVSSLKLFQIHHTQLLIIITLKINNFQPNNYSVSTSVNDIQYN